VVVVDVVVAAVEAVADGNHSGHGHGDDHDHPSLPCRVSSFALEHGFPLGAPRLRYAFRGTAVHAREGKSAHRDGMLRLMILPSPAVIA